MKKPPVEDKKLLKDLNAQLKKLQADLAEANKMEGKDPYLEVKVIKNQARFERVKKKGEDDKYFGKFFLRVEVRSKEEEVFIPVSLASGKKTAGFMYQIEGTAPGTIATTEIEVRGEGVSQISLGTLLFAKIPPGKTASFQIQVTTRGQVGKVYKIVFTRLNYKLKLTDVRYEQYLKAIPSNAVKFS